MSDQKNWLYAAAGIAVGVGGTLLAQRRLFALNEANRYIQSRCSSPTETENTDDIQTIKSNKKSPTRIYIDGCFDMMHYGHSNALRQARAAGDILVVGVHSDVEIENAKGAPPVMPEQERYLAVRACKFVDEVIEDAPYIPTKEWVDTLISKYNIDYLVHGDDPCLTTTGEDAYAYAKQCGVFKMIKRTEGVSTTDIVGRMLLMTREHHLRTPASASPAPLQIPGSPEPIELERRRAGSRGTPSLEFSTPAPSRFLPTARRIRQFSTGRAPTSSDKVVYICGAWDLFNAGHIAALQEARKLGTFLLVGIHDDDVVNRFRGKGYPILNLHERTLSVLSCRYADEVIIGAPWAITEDMIRSMNISVVAKGTVCDYAALSDAPDHTIEKAYDVPRSLNILQEFTSPSKLTIEKVMSRIMEQRETYERRFEKKRQQEHDYYGQSKQYVEET